MAPGHSGNGNGGSTNNIRLTHADLPHWQLGTKQALQGSDYVKIEPTSKIESFPAQVDFELPNKKCLLFGQMSKFRIQGGFQKQAAANAAWANCKAEEKDKVFLAPNWFEMLIKEVAIFHNHYKVASSSETRFIAPFLNAYLYQNMDPVTKKLLCPQAAHPAHCVPNWMKNGTSIAKAGLTTHRQFSATKKFRLSTRRFSRSPSTREAILSPMPSPCPDSCPCPTWAGFKFGSPSLTAKTTSFARQKPTRPTTGSSSTALTSFWKKPGCRCPLKNNFWAAKNWSLTLESPDFNWLNRSPTATARTAVNFKTS